MVVNKKAIGLGLAALLTFSSISCAKVFSTSLTNNINASKYIQVSFDPHVHSKNSYDYPKKKMHSVRELYRKSDNKNIDAINLSDHMSFKGCKKVKRLNKKKKFSTNFHSQILSWRMNWPPFLRKGVSNSA